MLHGELHTPQEREGVHWRAPEGEICADKFWTSCRLTGVLRERESERLTLFCSMTLIDGAVYVTPNDAGKLVGHLCRIGGCDEWEAKSRKFTDGTDRLTATAPLPSRAKPLALRAVATSAHRGHFQWLAGVGSAQT